MQGLDDDWSEPSGTTFSNNSPVHAGKNGCKKRKSEDMKNDLMELVYKKLSCAPTAEDEFLSFGKTVGLKLQKLAVDNKTAALNVQRIMNDALFKAETGRNLDNTVLTDVSAPPSFVTPTHGVQRNPLQQYSNNLNYYNPYSYHPMSHNHQ